MQRTGSIDRLMEELMGQSTLSRTSGAGWYSRLLRKNECNGIIRLDCCLESGSEK